MSERCQLKTPGVAGTIAAMVPGLADRPLTHLPLRLFIAHKRDEAAAGKLAGNWLTVYFADGLEPLCIAGADGDDEDAAFAQLLEQRGRHPLGSGGHGDSIVRSAGRPTVCAIAHNHLAVLATREFKRRRGAGRKFRMTFNACHL